MYGNRRSSRSSKRTRKYGLRVTSASVHTQVFSQSFDSGEELWSDETAANIYAEYEVRPEGWTDAIDTATAQSTLPEYEVHPDGWSEVPQPNNGGHRGQNSSAGGSQDNTETVQPHSSVAKRDTSNGALPSEPDETSESSNISEAQLLADIQSILLGSKASNRQKVDAGQQIDVEGLKSRNNQGIASQQSQPSPEAPLKQLKPNEHAIFDKIAQSMSMATTYDLGSVALQQRFDAFDDEVDAKQPPTWKTSSPKPPSRLNVESPQHDTGQTISHRASTSDFVHDLDLIKTEAKLANALENIPLDPGIGGLSIGTSALEVGDIILSTTDANLSAAIRAVTGSEVSHAALYIGDNQVIEAIEGGVVIRSLDTALSDDSLAVAYRHREMIPDKGRQLRTYAEQLAREQRGFDNWGLIRVAPGQLARSICNRLEGAARQACLERVGQLRVGTDDENRFFCSEFVLAALRHIGLGISTIDPSWSTPDEILTLQFNGLLDYVGHLKA